MSTDMDNVNLLKIVLVCVTLLNLIIVVRFIWSDVRDWRVWRWIKEKFMRRYIAQFTVEIAAHGEGVEGRVRNISKDTSLSEEEKLTIIHRVRHPVSLGGYKNNRTGDESNGNVITEYSMFPFTAKKKKEVIKRITSHLSSEMKIIEKELKLLDGLDISLEVIVKERVLH